MATFLVKGPDGASYRIQAPDDATKDDVADYMDKQMAAFHKASDPSLADQAHGALSSFLDGAMPGAGGVASGLVGAAMHPSHPLDGFKEARRASDRHEERFKQDHSYLGAAATGLGFAGSLALPVTKVGLVANAARTALGGRIVNAAANGALYGGLGGVLSSHADGPGGVLREGIRGAIGGAAVGGALPVADRIANATARPMAAAVGRKAAPAVAAMGRMIPGATGRNLQNRAAILGTGRVDATASRSIGDALDRSGMDSAALMAELHRRQATGVPAVPADLGEPLRQTFKTAARREGPALASVRRHIADRQQQATHRVVDHISETLGPITNVEQQADQLTARAKREAAPLYEISNAQHIPYVRELQELFSRPAGHQALQDAAYNLANQGINPATHGLIEGEDGIYRLGSAPTMQAYDYAKTALDHTVFAGKSPMAAPNVTRDSRGAMDIRNRLLDIMDGDGSGLRIPHPVEAPHGLLTASDIAHPDLPTPPNLPSPPPANGRGVGPWLGQRLEPQDGLPSNPLSSSIPPEGLNPYWKPARDAYGGHIQHRQALELGQDMAKAGATDAANRMGGMTNGSQRDFFRLGHRTGLADDVRALGDNVDAAGRLNGSLKAREAIATVHGPEASAALSDRLLAERDAFRTADAIRGGPKPDNAAPEGPLGDVSKGLMAAVSQRPLAALQHVAAAFRDEPLLTGPTADRVAGVLGSSDASAVREAMNGVRRSNVAKRAETAQSLSRQQQGAKVLGGRSGAGLATNDGEVLLGYGQNEEGSYYPVYGAPGTKLGPDYLPANL